jgi:hypothetical protein
VPLLASALEEILQQALRHPLLTFALLALLGSAFKAITTRRPATTLRPPPSKRADESELEARVRRNFEEMMRRRSAASAPPRASTPPRSSEGERSREGPRSTEGPRQAPRSPVDYDERARHEPTSTEGSRAPRVVIMKPASGDKPRSKERAAASAHLEAAAKAVKGTVRSAGVARTEKRARVNELRRGALDSNTLRRAVLLREILDPPIALRD